VQPLVLTDIDDTLIQTARKMPPDATKILAANSSEGKPLSFMHPWQADFVRWALKHTTLIPITARGIESFKRVQIPFQHGAVCLHGAAILNPDYSLDLAWHEHMQLQLQPYQNRISTLLHQVLELGKSLQLELRGWIEGIEEWHAYLVIKSTQAKAEELEYLWQHLHTQLDWSGFYVHQNANNLALIPEPVTKQSATAEIIRRHQAQFGRVPILGLGDSTSDLGFMRLCDFAAFPPHSQIGKVLP
jgi:hydroxymethylpyrimidine pyrophosphatase-like HAD family hydrolase